MAERLACEHGHANALKVLGTALTVPAGGKIVARYLAVGQLADRLLAGPVEHEYHGKIDPPADDGITPAGRVEH